MCNCVSCEYTDSFSGKGFDAWPKGEPKGPRKAQSEYSAHVAFGKSGLAAGWVHKPGQAPVYPARCYGFVPPVRLPAKYLAIIARGSIINEFRGE